MKIYIFELGFWILQITSSLVRKDRGKLLIKTKSKNQFVFRILPFIVFLILASSNRDFAQNTYTQKDAAVCKAKFDFAISDTLSKLPINDVLISIAKSFMGLEYESHTLDKNREEKLVIHLTGLDCYTFLEASLVFARLIKENKSRFNDFKKELENIRYRNGKLTDYASRLHYFSDWIYDMDKRGITKDITKEIGGISYQNDVNFMSTHPGSYLQLKADSVMIKKIDKIEKTISKREYFYIPQNEIAEVESKIHSGDILGITTNIRGLDISHTGIAIRENDGRIHLLHAPNVGKKIQISKEPLADYILKHKYQTGIIVSRVIEPKAQEK